MQARSVFVPLVLAALLPLPCTAQIQEQEIAASDAMADAFFGYSVAFQGGTAVVCAQTDNASGQIIGAAYVFERRGSRWQQTQKLLPTIPVFGMRFGESVGMAGDWVAVGADAESDFAGAVYLFLRQGSTYVQHQRLTGSDAGSQAHFGGALAIQQDRLIVGAPQKSTVAFGDGAAYVFELQGTTWIETAKLTASGPAHGDRFGTSVAILGDLAVVGATFADGPPADVGAGYVFERGPTGWMQTQKLLGTPSQVSQWTGLSVAALDDTIFLGAPAHAATFTNEGTVFVFERSGSSWVQTQQLFVDDPQQGLRFGRRMMVEGNRLLLGNQSDKDHGSNTGSAYLFKRIGSTWQQTGKLIASDATMSDTFGSSVALSGDIAIVGAPTTDGACPTNSNCNSGSAYLFRLGSDSVQYCSCAAPSGPCGNPDDHGGCQNSVGHGAVLAACGSGSVALDDLVLRCQWMPANQPALLFMGGTTASNPLGDGQLCVFPGPTGIHRYPAAFSTGQGSIQHGPGLVGLSQAFTPPGPIQPGEDRHFQVWFRDPAGPCGTVTNLSNAVRVTFGP